MVLRRGTTLLLAIGAAPVVLVGLVVVGQAGRAAALAMLGAWLLLVIALVAVDLALAASPRLLRYERTVPARVRLGEPAEAQLVVVNLSGRRFRGLVRDAWQPSAGQSVSRTTLDIPAGERRAFAYALVPLRRGERRVEQVTARASGPLGLAARQATVRVPGRIRVLPAFRSRRHLPSRLRRLRELDGRTTARVRGEGTEFDSIREYVRGDDVRSIDWRATARGAELPGAGRRLMLRTWRPERDRRIVVVVDTGRTAAARIGDEPRLDTAFEATLLLAALASRAGDRVDLLAYDRRVRGRVAAASATTVLAQMVEAMAPLEAELLETDWSAVPGQVRRLTSGRALVVLLTAVDSVGSTRGLLAALPQLTTRHLVVVAGATDPGLGRLAADRDPRQVYRAAAAERALLDQDRVAAAIRQAGAEVVTGAPADLPPALADRYLALKAAGRL